jgi:hypothetical protein
MFPVGSSTNSGPGYGNSGVSGKNLGMKLAILVVKR